MKYLIISNYDSQYGFSVCINGKVYERCENLKKSKIAFKIYSIFLDVEYRQKNFPWDTDLTIIGKLYGSKFDLIVYCENGGVEIIKDSKLLSKKRRPNENNK